MEDTLTFEQVELILDGIEYKPRHRLMSSLKNKTVKVWWHFHRMNIATGKMGYGDSGSVTFDLEDPSLSEENIVRGVWGMTQRLEEHESREFFSYFDQRPFEPHQKLIKDVITNQYDTEA